MGFRKRNVIGFVFDADGAPQSNVAIKFTPSKPFGYTNLHIVLNDSVTAQTNVGGSFTALLWCDEDSLIPIDYDVVVSNDAKRTGKISLAFEDGTDKPIGTLLLQSASPADLVGRETIIALVDARVDARVTAGGGIGAVQSRIANFSTSIPAQDEFYDLDNIQNADELLRALQTLIKQLKS